MNIRNMVATLMVVGFSFGAVATATGCGDPCEKTFDKMVECMSKEKGGEKMAKEFKGKKDEFVKECKKDDAKKKVAKKCSKESDCKNFIECFAKSK
jgi:hypothetical protein